MAVTNNIKKVVDLPVWEWLRFQPTISAAGTCMCASDDGLDRYIYYLNGANFWRYDAWTDGWQSLATCPYTPVTSAAMKYTEFGGFRGNCLGATSNTITLAGLKGNAFVGQKIRIMAGLGAGQTDRTINSITDAVVQDVGIASNAATTSVADSTKKWKWNQWVGYQVRITFGTGITQIRKVLYNDTTTLYFQDDNYQQLEAWNDTALTVTLSSTAPAESFYQIECSVATLDSNWTVTPDYTSSFVILSGGVWMLSAKATAPWSALWYYDVLSDVWNPKTALGGILGSALGTDWAFERTGEVGGTFLTGQATSAAARTLTDTSKTLTPWRYNNYQIRITGGTGVGQRRRIVTSLANTFYVTPPWDTALDTTSTYSIYGNTDSMYLVGNNAASMYQYAVEIDSWSQGQPCDWGTCRNGGVFYVGQEAFGITSGTRTAGALLTINPIPTAGGTGYLVGDILTISAGGTNGKVRVESTNAGVVTGLSLYDVGGVTYVVGTGRATTGGTGSGCTVEITAVCTAGVITTASNHNLCVGDSVTLSGASEAAWNGVFTVIGVTSLTVFSINANSTASPWAATASQGTTTLVDSTKNWTASEHIGKLVQIQIAGPAPTTQVRRITANTATTLTVATIVAGGNGTSRYIIHEPSCLGRESQIKIPSQSSEGMATGGGATTLIDSTKSWVVSQWVGYRFRIISGTGVGSEIAITASNATTLTFGSQSFSPDATTRYQIMDTFGIATSGATTSVTDTTKNWVAGFLAGKRVRITGGTNNLGAEAQISSANSATQASFSAMGAVNDATSTYVVLSENVKAAGCSLQWIYGNSVAANKGRYLYSSKGTATYFDRYDLTQDLWDFTLFTSPQTESFVAGTMWAYDSADRLYFTVGATGRVFYLDVNTLKVMPAGMTPYAQGVALLGNKMEIITTADGLNYLYIGRHTGQEFWRTLLFW